MPDTMHIMLYSILGYAGFGLLRTYDTLRVECVTELGPYRFPPALLALGRRSPAFWYREREGITDGVSARHRNDCWYNNMAAVRVCQLKTTRWACEIPPIAEFLSYTLIAENMPAGEYDRLFEPVDVQLDHLVQALNTSCRALFDQHE
jgi:hypothetical protein